MWLEEANKTRRHSDDDEDSDVEFALTQLNHLLQLDSENSSDDTTLDEKAKLVLKRLLTGATEHAFHSYSKVIEEEQITSGRHQSPKEIPQLRTLSNKISRSSHRDVPCCSSLSSFSKKGCPINERNRLNLILNSHDEGNYRNVSAKEKPKVTSTLLRTASQAKDNQASSSSSSSYRQSGNAKEQFRRQILPLPALLELEYPNASARKHVSRQRKNMVETRTRRRTRTSASPSFSSSYSSSPSYKAQRGLSRKHAKSSSSSSTSRGDRRRRSMRASRRMMVDPSRKEDEEEVEERVGRLQRFKNKLGLIFHHHHHHHHHHHEADPNKALSRHNHSVWNYLQKMTHRTPTTSRKHKDGEAGKRGGMVDGLVRQVWHSNKTDKKRSHSRSSAVVVNKWHWWQKFYKRKGVVRQNSNNRKRGKVRFGFTAAKRPPRLPALKFK
ncbi:hypothetical protein ACHQM5_015125 [Ranunculus cassubicifolius]